MPIPGNLLTTAMGVMPHLDADRALEEALMLDIPYWPQLPNLSYYEDMYVQASEHFPGIVLDMDNRKLSFSMDKFMVEFEEAYSKMEDPYHFDISVEFSSVYHKFLKMDLSEYPAIRGQLEGPISLGFSILDQNDRPILFDDNVRPLIYEILARRVNIQLGRLQEKNKNAFMFIDEPGLQYLFSAMSGYNDISAKKDMEYFFSMIDRPRGVHLCGNPDWDFLLELDMEILSLDAYTNKEIISSYSDSLKKFLQRDGIICWGIVPTNAEPYNSENIDSMMLELEEIWETLTHTGIDMDFLLSRSMLSPATCCLINPDGEKTVEKAFRSLKDISQRLREKYKLS